MHKIDEILFKEFNKIVKFKINYFSVAKTFTISIDCTCGTKQFGTVNRTCSLMFVKCNCKSGSYKSGTYASWIGVHILRERTWHDPRLSQFLGNHMAKAIRNEA